MNITSKQIKITAFTHNCKIEGLFTITEDNRLTDVLNSKKSEKDFIPINKATITYLKNMESLNVDFLSLNKNNIEVIFEENN